MFNYQGSFVVLCCRLLSSAATFIDYHVVRCLSRTFFIFFSAESRSIPFPQATALIYYHINSKFVNRFFLFIFIYFFNMIYVKKYFLRHYIFTLYCHANANKVTEKIFFPPATLFFQYVKNKPTAPKPLMPQIFPVWILKAFYQTLPASDENSVPVLMPWRSLQ